MKPSVHHLCIGLLTVALGCTAQAQTHPPTWNSGAKDTEWRWEESFASPFGSLERCNPKYDVRILRTQKEKRFQHPIITQFFITILEGAREVFTFEGHYRTVFAIHDDRLYYGDFSPSSTGAHIVAVDLSTEKQLWREPVLGIGTWSHFSYSNAILLSVNARSVTIWGNEDGGQYFEAKDPDTGVTTTHKLFSRNETDAAAANVRMAVGEYYRSSHVGDLLGVKRYLSAGLDVNAKCNKPFEEYRRTTALLLAVEKGSPAVVESLLDHGHAMTPRSGDLKTPFELAVDSAVKAAGVKPAKANPPVVRETGLTTLEGALKCSLFLLQHGAPTTPAALDTLRGIAKAAGDTDLLRTIDQASLKPAVTAPPK